MLRVSLLTYYFIEAELTSEVKINFSKKIFQTLIPLITYFSNWRMHYFFEGCQADLTSHFFSSHLFNTFPDFLTYISLLTYYLIEGCQAELTSEIVLLISRLVDPGSGFRPILNFYVYTGLPFGSSHCLLYADSI